MFQVEHRRFMGRNGRLLEVPRTEWKRTFHYMIVALNIMLRRYLIVGFKLYGRRSQMWRKHRICAEVEFLDGTQPRVIRFGAGHSGSICHQREQEFGSKQLLLRPKNLEDFIKRVLHLMKEECRKAG